jgi:hypothetical protein
MTGQHWEGWQYDQAIAAYWAPRIQQPLRGIIPGSVAHSHPGGGIDRAQMLVRSSVDGAAAGRLSRVLVRQRATATVIGAKVALGQVRAVGGTGVVPPPGLVAALEAAKRTDYSVTRDLLSRVDSVTIADWESAADKAVADVTRSVGGQVAKVLAAGWERGDSTDTIARLLDPILQSSSRAETISITETARWMVGGSLDTYNANGISLWDWLISPGACPICIAYAAGGPYGLNAPAPPGHPRCRCATGPVVDLSNLNRPIAITGLPGMSGLSGSLNLAALAGTVVGTLVGHSGSSTPISMGGSTDPDDDQDDDEDEQDGSEVELPVNKRRGVRS